MLRNMMLLGVAVVLASGISLVTTSVAPEGGLSHALAAGGGNSAAAHSCQQGGYVALIGTNGTTDTRFTNTAQCVSYTAQGGTLVSLSSAQPCLDGGWQTLTSVAGQPAFSSEAACVQFTGGGGTPVPVESFSVSVKGPSTVYPGTCDLQFTGTGLMPYAGVYMDALGFTDGVPTTTGRMAVPESGVLNDVGVGFANGVTLSFMVEGTSGDTLTYGPMLISC